MTDPRPEVSTEVAGTPEEVWEHIATGPGISTWFMPAEVEPHVGGTISQRHGDSDEDVSHGTITAYDPPHRLVYEETGRGKTIATEFLVEAHSGGTCVVRIVTHGLTADDADFADGLTSGWTQALGVLRVRLAAFADQPAGSSRLWTSHEGSLDDAWSDVARRVGLEGASVGDRTELGTIEVVQPHAVLLRVDDGVLSFIGTGFGGRTSIVVDRYAYGDGAQEAADAERRRWEAALV